MEVKGTPELRSMLDFIESRISQDGRNPNIEQVCAAFYFFHREEAPVPMFVERWASPPNTHESQMSGILDAEFIASFIPFTILSKIDEFSVEASKGHITSCPCWHHLGHQSLVSTMTCS